MLGEAGGIDPFDTALDNYLRQTTVDKSEYFIVIFSGTTFVQEQRGNRPIRQTKTFLGMNIPVLFSYWRWRKDEVIPVNPVKNLFQSPIDKTLKYLDQIIDYDFKSKRKVFIVSFPHPSITSYLERLKAHNWVTIYDARDDWEEFQKVGQAKWFDPQVEKFVVENCDVVCAVSRVLKDKMQTLTGNKIVQLSPNALDSSFLKEGKVEISPRDGKPVIGYVGHLSDSWFDWLSLITIAKLKPHWRFEIIGHFIPQNLMLPPNLLYLGPKNHPEIKEMAKEWRTAIIPFKIGNLSDSVDPIKIYEYLAMGLPVVSFRMPQIHTYPYVFISNNVDEFVIQIQNALNCSMDSNVIEEFLLVNRWEDRAKQFLEWSSGR